MRNPSTAQSSTAQAQPDAAAAVASPAPVRRGRTPLMESRRHVDKKWWTLLAVCAGTFMLLLDVTIVNVALPDIQRSLHASFADLQWVVDAYALTLAVLLLTAGSLADRYGRRLLFTIGLAVFTAGSLLCGLAQSSVMLILSRGGQGVGGAIMFATSLALLAQSFQGRERGTAFGVWGATTGVATALGPVLGGLITSGVSWRGIFLVNVPVGILAVAVTVLRVQESRSAAAHRPDWAGFALFTVGLGALVYGMIRAGETGWGQTGVIVCMVLAIGCLVGFVLTERRVADPMFDLSLFRTPTFLGGSIAALTMNGSLFAMFLYLVLYLQDILGLSALAVGVRLLILSGCSLLAAIISGRLSARMPVRLLIGPGLALVGIGLLLMAGLQASSQWTHLIPGFVVAGIGSGLVNPPLASTAIGVVEPARAGMASGINTTFRQVGIAASIAALGTVFADTLHRRISHGLVSVPGSASHLARILTDIRSGQAARAIATFPADHRARLARLITSSFVAGINGLLIITAIIALLGAAFSLWLIRSRDFAPRIGAAGPGVSAVPEPARRVV
jgi:EmrB/QacA subfamily drug resistance transporter